MRKYRTSIVAVSLGLLAAAGVASADDAPAADAPAVAKPVIPTVSDILDASGITATGYVSGTFNAQTFSEPGGTAPKNYDTFTLQQAAFTLSKLPTSGFGALVNVLGGQNIYTPNYAYGSYGASAVTSTQVQLAQAYGQYIYGPITAIAGKFVTLAGAEVLASVGNTNITRSILYSYEPVTHTGVRVTYAATGELNLILGANDGWVVSDEVSAGSGKTVEAGVAWTPSKAFAWSVQGYSGNDTNKSGIISGQTLVDTVATWNATSAWTFVVSADWAQVNHAYGTGTSSASWWGTAAYANYAINDLWRISLRGEYYDDKRGYLTMFTENASSGAVPADQGLTEGTLTFGYDPTKNVELRLEGRYDKYDGNYRVGVNELKVSQGWLEALYKF